MSKHLAMLLCVGVLCVAAWIGSANQNEKSAPKGWTEVAPGILRSPGLPAGYALIDGGSALLIDAPVDGQDLKDKGIKTIDVVLLTHHHRPSCAAVGEFLNKGIKVRAAKTSAEWLTPEGVAKYWKTSIPLRGSRTAYLVVPEGFDGIDCSLDDGQEINWRGWNIQVVSTPGHSLSHLSFVACRVDGEAKNAAPSILCGGAMAEPGKIWAPYTTDWDHWTDAGLAPTAKSLRRLAELKPSRLMPAHGPVIEQNATDALIQTAKTVEEVGFLKSFERFTKTRLGNPPDYKFLVKEQAMTNGTKPWSRVSEHLYITGNNYVLVSKDNRCLMLDPFQKWCVDQFEKLQKDHMELGKLEVVMFTHAHYDHYDGIYYFPEKEAFEKRPVGLPDRERVEVWMLDKASTPVADPFLLRAPFLDARPVRIDKMPKDGDVLTWREYRFRFCHLPGQSEFTMGIETEIDGKKCFFTADNFFHQDMFSGSGGWMGLNRSWPGPYGESAKKVLDAAPDWVLAEHGGPYEFSAEDYRRRVAWGKAGVVAADALSVSGNHRLDWNPHHVHFEPLVQKGKAGKTVQGKLVVTNPLSKAEKLQVVLNGRGITKDQRWDLDVAAGGTKRVDVNLALAESLKAGRHVFDLRSTGTNGLDISDAFLVVDID